MAGEVKAAGGDSREQIRRCLNCQYPARYCTGRLYERCRAEKAPGSRGGRAGRPRGLLYAMIGPVISGEMSAADFSRLTGYSEQQISRARRKLRESQPMR